MAKKTPFEEFIARATDLPAGSRALVIVQDAGRVSSASTALIPVLGLSHVTWHASFRARTCRSASLEILVTTENFSQTISVERKYDLVYWETGIQDRRDMIQLLTTSPVIET